MNKINWKLIKGFAFGTAIMAVYIAGFVAVGKVHERVAMRKNVFNNCSDLWQSDEAKMNECVRLTLKMTQKP